MIVLVLVVGSGVIGTLLLARHRPADANRATVLASPSCAAADSVTLGVQVAPGLAVPVTRIVQDWTNHNPTVAGKCIQVELASPAMDQQELSLQNAIPTENAASTSVWLPDSTVWAQRLAADLRSHPGGAVTITLHPGIASSPLVAVAGPAEATKLAARLADPNFDPFAGAAIPEPVHNAEGLLSLLSETPQSSSASLSQGRALVARLLAVSRNAYANPLAGFGQLAGAPGRTGTFVASEQAVIEQNQQRGALVAVAVYPAKPTLGLDFPVVRLSRPGDPPALAQAADEFEQALRTPYAAARYAEAGLRSPDGTPVPKLGAEQGVTPDLVPPAPAPGADQTINLIRLWNAAVADANDLAVIDLSGSMADPAGNGQSKVAVAAAAAERAVTFFPDTSALGLWVFSTDQGAGTSWSQLVPLGPLSDKLGAQTRRQALLAAAAGMPGRVHGGTALYDTVLAAYRQVQAGYDPSKVNSVVLMTDGKNEDTSSTRTLEQLLAQLRSIADPQRPIRVITIGIGSGADTDALGKIAAATGGKSYLVQNAADISGVFLDAIAQRK
ncbi:MAG TPA: VWA domain-containing protein [Jatrophihabitans sp.]|nr:VWA domain-containing protein [Jatrophihabitans sp.]